MRFLKKAGLAAMALAAAGPAAAQERGWAMIGRGEADSDGAGTVEARQLEPFREIMLCVSGADVRFNSLTVRVREGTPIAIRLAATVRDGGCSRFISLRGRRDVAGIDFTNDASVQRGATGRVELFAR